jgi:hypothetical protein
MTPQQKPDALQTSAPWQLKCFWISLEERSRTNSSRQRFHSLLFCKTVRYFCRTLYIYIYIYKPKHSQERRLCDVILKSTALSDY